MSKKEIDIDSVGKEARPNKIKQVIVIRKDLNMRKGKMAAQAAHASMGVILDLMHKWVDPETKFNNWELVFGDVSYLGHWLKGSFVKICVGVDSNDEMDTLYELAKDRNIPSSYIKDSGFTEFHGEKTPTCIAIGPWDGEEIDKITGHLKLL